MQYTYKAVIEITITGAEVEQSEHSSFLEFSGACYASGLRRGSPNGPGYKRGSPIDWNNFSGLDGVIDDFDLFVYPVLFFTCVP